MVNDNYTELRGEIVGPPDTAYDGGKFILEIKIPETYPFNPPKVKCVKNLSIFILNELFGFNSTDIRFVEF